MKIQHVILGYTEHLLVVDGVRGPLASYGPATHPAGLIAFHPNTGYPKPDHAGKVFREVPDIEVIEDTACEPAEQARKELVEIVKTCTEIKLARYGVEASK